jgi:hypothetical protein
MQLAVTPIEERGRNNKRWQVKATAIPTWRAVPSLSLDQGLVVAFVAVSTSFQSTAPQSLPNTLLQSRASSFLGSGNALRLLVQSLF